MVIKYHIFFVDSMYIFYSYFLKTLFFHIVNSKFWSRFNISFFLLICSILAVFHLCSKCRYSLGHILHSPGSSMPKPLTSCILTR